MGTKIFTPLSLTTLAGINLESQGRLSSELPDCKNIYGEATGFSVWKGRKRWGTITPTEATSYIKYFKWPDQHDSYFLFGNRKMRIREISHQKDITGALTFNADPRNPMHITPFLRNQYAVGANYLRDQPFTWDGNLSHDLQVLPHTYRYRVIVDFAERLWGFDSFEEPLLGHYGLRNTLSLEHPSEQEFRDGPASRILGGIPYNRNYMLVWGDRGLWMVEWTGSYPLFARSQLISKVCDCVSFNSIVALPDGGFVWMGRENIWGIQGNTVVDIGQSADARKARRVQAYLRDRIDNDLFMTNGAYYGRRDAAIWSWCKDKLDTNDWWNQRQPISLVWNSKNNSFWYLDQGYISLAEVEYLNERRLVSADPDGHLWLIDYDIAKDKYKEPTRTLQPDGTWVVHSDGDPGTDLQWFADFEWLGDASSTIKFQEARLVRSIKGPDRVMVKFYDQFEATPVETHFSLKENFDGAGARKATTLDVTAGRATAVGQTILASGWISATAADVAAGRATAEGEMIPPFNPGGPNDLGLPPDPKMSCQAEIRITGHYLKVKLHNNNGGSYIDGPEKPMESLTVLARVV